MLISALPLLAVLLLAELVAGEEKELHLLGLFPFEGAWYGGQSLLTSVRMGLEEVNRRNDILPGYKLVLHYEDTKCQPGFGTHKLFEMLYKKPTKILLLGAGCSTVSQATGQVSHIWNLVQLSYASVSPALSDKTRFPWFFRVSAPDVTVNPSRIEMMKQFKWDKVATVHQSLDIFSFVTEDIVRLFRENNITLLTSEVFSNDPTTQVRNLKKQDARVIVCGMYANMAPKLFCEAYKQGMYGPKYVWFGVGWWDDRWWEWQDQGIDCTLQQMRLVAEGYFGNGIVYLNPVMERGIGNMTSDEFVAEYDKRTNYTALYGDIMAPQGYDSIFVIALALNATLTQLRDNGSTKGLENFTYADREMALMIHDNMKKVDLTGIRGHISFNKNNDPVGLVKIERVQGGIRKIVGFYNPGEPEGKRIQWSEDTSKSAALKWLTRDGKAPKASTIIVKQIDHVSSSLYVAMCTLAGSGILLAIAFLVFNIAFRKVRLIKMSSPNINSVILIGCIICYSTVFFQERDLQTGTLFCKMRAWSVTIGFCTAFGALFSKTWRVHVIFTNVKLKKKVVKDSQLLIMVFLILVINVTVLTVWELVDPQYIQLLAVGNEERDGGEIIVNTHVGVCYSEYKIYFVCTLYAIQGIMLLFGAFLAWETRKVKIPALNDSQYIGMCVYNVMVLSLIGVGMTLVLQTQVLLQYGLISSLLILGTTATQCIVFLPKVLNFRASRTNPEEDMCTNTDLKRAVPTTTVTAVTSEQSKVAQLEKELKEARDAIESQAQEINNLKKNPGGASTSNA